MKYNPITYLKDTITRAVNDALTDKRGVTGDFSQSSSGFSFGSYGEFNTSNALTLSSVFRAVNLISNGIATLQMKLYKIDSLGFKSELTGDALSNILGCEPNEELSRYVFFKQLEQYKLNRGNAYVLITRDKWFKPVALNLIAPDFVFPLKVDGRLKYYLTQTGQTVDPSNMIHIMNYPVTDAIGITRGISTLEFANNSIATSVYADRTAKEFFKSGANNAGILNSITPFKTGQAEQIQNNLRNSASMDSLNPNGVTVIGGTDLKLIPFGITPKDSQLIEARKWNISDVGRFYNVNPILLFAGDSKLSNAENAQLDFLNTTLLPEIELLENEFTRKLILPSERQSKEIRFDLGNLLRADSTSRSAYFESMNRIGVLSANDVAKEMNLPYVKGGDVHTIGVNLQDIENIIYNQGKPLDNKTKMNTPKE
jgi:HK97 family phage portal protein